MRPFRAFLLSALLLAAPPLGAQPPLTEHEGAAGLGLALRRLGVDARVLMIAAHPDDESTQILATLALGHGADVAYLSLTRGEGGQNGIGPELQEALGLLRSEELLAARRLDGARQFFTRAYDYGFSKDADEAFRHWPRDTLLADVVEVVRAFRPDVIVSVFTGTEADGHGQHEAAGLLAREAFGAAADPARFPEQLARGLRPHAAAVLYGGVWSRGGPADVRLQTGELDPLLGRSAYQVAMASRSRHRSQDMGRPLTPGPQASGLRVLAARADAPAGGTNGAPPGERASFFAGLDTTLSQRAAQASAAAAEAAARLRAYEVAVGQARAEFNPMQLAPLAARLDAASGLLRQAESAVARLPAGERAELGFRLAVERAELDDALVRAAGLVLDAVAEAEQVVPGQEFTLTLTLWNGGAVAAEVDTLAPTVPVGWQATALDSLPARLAAGELLTRRFRVRVAADAAATEPFFLRAPRRGDLYRWPHGTPPGMPFEPPAVRAGAVVRLGEARLPLRREATFRGLDRRQGEFRRPLRVVPPVTVAAAPQVLVLPLGNGAPREPLRVQVRVASASPVGAAGRLRLELPPGWRSEPETVVLRFGGAGEERPAEFRVWPPTAVRAGEYRVGAVFVDSAGTRFARGFSLVDYPHVQPRALYRPAEVQVSAFPGAVAPGLNVGYVMGAGDDGPEALRQLGVRVVPLDADSLARGDLARYHAIVTGVRAYEVRPDLAAHNARLLDYARAGGTLVVQYNKYEFTEPGVAPFPLKMARPHDRVTDETAPVSLLQPQHPALSWPNRITAADFDGWVQERGLYHLREWDARYTPLLEMADPGEPPQRGALLVAPLGKGTYVYTGLALFRQLPAGVPGAYRLLANLVSLGSARR